MEYNLPRTPAPQPCRSRSSSLGPELRTFHLARWRSCTWCRCVWRFRMPDPRSIPQTVHFPRTSPSSSWASHTALPERTRPQRDFNGHRSKHNFFNMLQFSSLLMLHNYQRNENYDIKASSKFCHESFQKTNWTICIQLQSLCVNVTDRFANQKADVCGWKCTTKMSRYSPTLLNTENKIKDIQLR